MNPLLCMASEPYLTNPKGYPGRHQRVDIAQAEADCIAEDWRTRGRWLYPNPLARHSIEVPRPLAVAGGAA